MKITFEGVTRVLDLDHNTSLKKSIAIQEYTGLAVMDWRMALVTRDVDALAGAAPATMAQAASKMTALTDMGWVKNMAAAHWLMLAQNEENPPPLDDDYDPDVMGFADAFFAALIADAKAQQVSDKPAPKASPARRTPSSRQTATRKTLPPAAANRPASDPGEYPPTGS